MRYKSKKVKPLFKRNSIVPLGSMLLLSSVAVAQDFSGPESVTYEIYSGSSAELFWLRPEQEGLTYEVSRDGLLLDTTNGVSYYDRTLARGATYEYSIVAVTASGDRSEESLVSFSIEAGSESSGVSDSENEALPLLRPTGLIANVYSSRSAELFWERPVKAGLTYDVLQNDSLVHTTDGVSFYIRDLVPGTDYEFEVVAVDAEGNRSIPAVASFSTTGSTQAEQPAEDDPIAELVAPTGLRAAVYSSRSAELFWDRPATAGLTYEITRDGAPLGTTDGVSFNDKTLAAGSSYTYQVLAINTIGERSPASGVIVNTQGSADVGNAEDGTDPEVDPEVDPEPPIAPSNSITAADIQEPEGFFDTDGYSTVDVVRLDVRTVTEAGICTDDDESGCTLDDVKADIDGDDDFTVDIPIHFQGADLPDDGSINNAELRQRGGFTRLAPQKSFRVKLDSKNDLWRNERRLQLNKMPYDQSRIRNKLAFDLMQDIPHLPSLRTQFVNLWIDDGAGPEDYGLFTHAEYVGKEFLVNRDWDTDDNIYKIEEFVFAPSDLEYLAVDADGEPLDEDRFETRLGIKSGDDHSKVTEMINAVNDNERSFDSILEQYFDKDNVLAWVTVNFLLHQMDAVTHNFYLYNPVGSDKFYFMPWDYDGTFAVEQKPANSLETSELLRRLYYGLSKGRASNFLNRYYRQPGIHAQMVARAADLRNNYLTDTLITELASTYSAVISEYAGQLPDLEHNSSFDVSNSSGFAGFIAENHAALVDYGIPFPPKLRDVEESDGILNFRWREAHVMAGNEVEYELEISSAPDFNSEDMLLSLTGLSLSDGSGYEIDSVLLGSGVRYARLTARSLTNPDEFWQTASNRPVIDGEMRVGVVEFESP